MINIARGAVPRSFWAISGLSLLWNAFGVYDFTMTNLRNPAYIANFPPGMVALLDATPGWAIACWALGVWGSLAGSLLLLLRSRHAAAAFALSLLGASGSYGYQLIHWRAQQQITPGAYALMAMIVAVIVFLLWYSRREAARSVLR